MFCCKGGYILCSSLFGLHHNGSFNPIFSDNDLGMAHWFEQRCVKVMADDFGVIKSQTDFDFFQFFNRSLGHWWPILHRYLQVKRFNNLWERNKPTWQKFGCLKNESLHWKTHWGSICSWSLFDCNHIPSKTSILGKVKNIGILHLLFALRLPLWSAFYPVPFFLLPPACCHFLWALVTCDTSHQKSWVTGSGTFGDVTDGEFIDLGFRFITVS